MRLALVITLTFMSFWMMPDARAFQEDNDVSWEELTAQTEHLTGLFDLYVDRDEGRVLAALPSDGETVLARYIHTIGLTAGSDPIR